VQKGAAHVQEMIIRLCSPGLLDCTNPANKRVIVCPQTVVCEQVFLTRSSQDEIFVTRGLLDYSASGTLPLGPCGSQAVGGVYFGMSLSELFVHGKAWCVADLFCCTCG